MYLLHIYMYVYTYMYVVYDICTYSMNGFNKNILPYVN